MPCFWNEVCTFFCFIYFSEVEQLSLCIRKSANGSYNFHYCQKAEDKIDYSSVKPPVSWEEVCRKLRQHKFRASQRPPWRVRKVEEKTPDTGSCYNYYIIFNVHHSIMDGVGLVKIIGRFLQLINSVFNNTSLPNVRYSMCESADNILKENLRCLTTTEEQNVSNVQSFFGQCHPESGRMRLANSFKAISFSSNETDKILNLCKRYKVKVNSFLTALFTQSLGLILLKDSNLDLGLIKYMYAVNLRRYMPENYEDSLGHFAEMVESYISCESSFTSQRFWDLVVETEKHIYRSLEEGAPLKVIEQKLKAKGHQDEKLINIILDLKQPCCDVSLSNLGRAEQYIKLEDNAIIRPTAMFQSTSSSEFPVSFYWNTVTINNNLCCLVDYNEKYVKQTQAEEYVKLVKQIVAII